MKKIAVFTSGGDSPGMNACLRAVFKTEQYFGIDCIGIKRGYQGMIENDFVEVNNEMLSNIIHRGGTILKTARSEQFRTKEGRIKAFENLKNNHVDGLICIGGNGTYTGAKIFYEEFNIPSIGIPGTIDNDLYGTDMTIGYDSAMNTAVQCIDKIRDTADAHDRVFFVEVMGRDSGFLALNTGLASGADSILLPEIMFDYQAMISHFRNHNDKKFSIIIVSEKDENGKTNEIVDNFKKEFPEKDVKLTILGHIQRGGSPSAFDRILANTLGAHAVKLLLKGKTNLCVGLVNHQINQCTYDEAINKSKTIDKKLWRLSQILAN